MPASHENMKKFRGRQLSDDAVRFLEKIRGTKGVHDAWASGNDLTFVKLSNFKVICLRGLSTDGLEEHLAEVNKMEGRSTSLNSGLDDLELPQQFRSRTRSELMSRPTRYLGFTKRRTSDTAAADMQLAQAKFNSGHHGNDSPKESRGIMSKVDETRALTADDIQQEYERRADSDRSRSASLCSGSSKLSASPTSDLDFRPRANSDLPPRPRFDKLLCAERNGYSDSAEYFTLEKGLVVPDDAKLKSFMPKAMSKSDKSLDSTKLRMKCEFATDGKGGRHRSSSFGSKKSSPVSKPLFTGKPGVEVPVCSTLMNFANRRLSLSGVPENDSTNFKKREMHRRISDSGPRPNMSPLTTQSLSSLNGMMPKNHRSISVCETKSDFDRMSHNYSTASCPANGFVSSEWTILDIDSERGEGFYDPYGLTTQSPQPTTDVINDAKHELKDTKVENEKNLNQSSRILSFFRRLISPSSQTKTERTNSKPNLFPRRLSVDSQLVANPLQLNRNAKKSNTRKIKIPRSDRSKAMYISGADSLGGLPDDDVGLNPLSLPTRFNAMGANTNQLGRQGRRSSCPVIYESDESEDTDEGKHKRLSILPERKENRLSQLLYNGNNDKKNDEVISPLKERKITLDRLPSKSKSCQDVFSSLGKRETSEKSLEDAVEDDEKDFCATSEIEGVTFIVDRGSSGGTPSSKSENSDNPGHVNNVSSDIISSDECHKTGSATFSEQKRRRPQRLHRNNVPQHKLSSATPQEPTVISPQPIPNGESGHTKNNKIGMLSKCSTESSISISSLSDDSYGTDYSSDVSSVTTSAEDS